MRLFVNKSILAGLTLALSAIYSIQSFAAFTLNGTRFIFEEGRKNISVEVSNNSADTYGGQVWVDNTTQPSSEVYFTPAPSFFKISGGERQVIRLLNISSGLPEDRESLFWLNVQEIPPASTKDGNVLALALNTQVKLIYRPEAIKKNRDKAEQGIKVDGSVLKNTTPYYFAITSIAINGKKVKLSEVNDKRLSEFSPFSEVDLGFSLSGPVLIEAIDDYGARRVYNLK
ncbi:fimbrial chaperone [Salmonella enterica subsp. enterica serovar Typhimurium]|nr:fimbrial chaperone [Salmonella enterica subsp. enterica serovar Typhimurium]